MSELDGKTVGWGVTAAHQIFPEVLGQIAALRARGARVVPVLSDAVQRYETAAGPGSVWVRRFSEAAGEAPILTVEAAEPIGPRRSFDAMIVAPCTGTTLAKMANSIYDTPVLTAIKAMLRNGSPVVLGLATNDALGLNALNLARLLVARHVYFVPMAQDHPEEKPTSLVADWTRCLPALESALRGRQLQPLFLSRVAVGTAP